MTNVTDSDTQVSVTIEDRLDDARRHRTRDISTPERAVDGFWVTFRNRDPLTAGLPLCRKQTQRCAVGVSEKGPIPDALGPSTKSQIIRGL